MTEKSAAPDAGSKRPVLARRRQALILERVREQGAVRVTDLVRALGVSDMTIRRDLGILHDRGLLEKVHGGAAAIEDSSLLELGFTTESTQMQAEKLAIAACAAALVLPKTVIALSAGTTTFALAGHLTDIPGLTVLTNSAPVADVLHKDGRPDQTVILCGGVRTPSDALVGPFAVNVIRSLHVDTVFMGTHGMDGRSGFTTPNILEADTNRALIATGRRLIVLADHTKWGIVAMNSVARLEDADTIISDVGLAPAARDQIAATVRRLMLVDAATGDVRVLEAEDDLGTPAGVGGARHG
jgi:DeoR/GlpR family transcriptional regulator of sugar metabolism